MTQTMFQQDAMITWLLLGRGSRLVQQLVSGIGPRKGQVDAIQQAAIEVNLPPYLLTFCFGEVIFDPFPERGYNISVSMFFWKRLTVFVWEILKNDNIITLWMLDCSIALMLDFWKREDIGNYDQYALLTIPCLPTGTMECWRPLTGGLAG